MTELTEADPLRTKLATIQRSGQKAADIVQDLLSLSRKDTTAKTPIDLNTMISESLQKVEFKHLQATYPELDLDARLDSQPLGVMAPPALLSRVLSNLVLNAAEATSVGEAVSIATSSQTIAQTQNGYEQIPPATYAVLSISDNGIGLTEDELVNILEPFFTNKVLGRSGTGLGMAVVWGALKDHQGFIDIHSKPNAGTRFTLYFPKVRLITSQATSQTSVEDYKGRGESVLVVDDVKDQRLIASSIMAKLGYRVECASSGEAAVAFLKEHPMDLIILDMVMEPGMDGLDTYQEILKIRPDQKNPPGQRVFRFRKNSSSLGVGSGKVDFQTLSDGFHWHGGPGRIGPVNSSPSRPSIIGTDDRPGH
jgi:two-component system cell cycle sensor histidine kinase/response regulator CckA